MPPGDWLYLFSSNASPQYAQDILNVFACAAGQQYVFRYERKWVDGPAQARWLNLRDDDTWVLICFSLQQRAFFHDPAFIPIRLGRVAATTTIGSHFFVRFTVGRYVSLPAPTGPADQDYAERVL